MITRFSPTRERNSLQGEKRNQSRTAYKSKVVNPMLKMAHQRWYFTNITLRHFLRSLNILSQLMRIKSASFYPETCFHSRWQQPPWQCPWWHHGAGTALCCVWRRSGGSNLKWGNALPCPHASHEPPPNCREFLPLYKKQTKPNKHSVLKCNSDWHWTKQRDLTSWETNDNKIKKASNDSN